MVRRSLARNRHALFYLEQVEQRVERGERALLVPEWPNLKRAIDWASESGQRTLLHAFLRAGRTLLEELNAGPSFLAWAEDLVRLVRRDGAGDGEDLNDALAILIDAHQCLANSPGPGRSQALKAASVVGQELLRRYGEEHARYPQACVELGLTLSRLAEVSPNERATQLENAVDHFERALNHGGDDPVVRRNALSNRALALKDLATLPGRDRARLMHDALTTLRVAERELAEAGGNLDQLATTRLNIANLLHESPEGVGGYAEDRLPEALELLERVIRDAPSVLARGRALVSRANINHSLAEQLEEDPRARLLAALASHDQALAAFRDHPLLYATSLSNRAGVLLELGQLAGEDRAARADQAIVDLEQALAIREGAAIEEITTRNNLAQARLERMHAAGEPSLVEVQRAFVDAAEGYRLAEALEYGTRLRALLVALQRVRDEAAALGGLAHFEAWWREAFDRPLPDWPAPTGTAPYPQGADSLMHKRRSTALMRYMRVHYAERVRLMKEHGDVLLADETIAQLAQLAEAPELDESTREDLHVKLHFFQRSKALGVDGAVAEWEADNQQSPKPPPEVAAKIQLLQDMTPEEANEYARAHPDEIAELKAGGWIDVVEQGGVRIQDPGFVERVSTFLSANDLEERLRLLREHEEDLCSSSAEVVFDAAEQSHQGRLGVLQRLAQLRQLVERTRSVGFEAAAEEARREERDADRWRGPLERLLAARSMTEAGELLLTEGEALLRDEVARELTMLVEAQEAPAARHMVELYRTMVRRARELGPRRAISEGVLNYYAQMRSLEERREFLALELGSVLPEHVEPWFDELLELNRSRPGNLPSIRRARDLLLRTIEIGIDDAFAEEEAWLASVQRFQKVYGGLFGVTVPEGVALFEEHRDVLTDPAMLAMIQEGIDAAEQIPEEVQGHELTVEAMRSQLWALRRCAAEGPHPVFDGIVRARKVLHELSESTDAEERLRLARENQELLLGGSARFDLVHSMIENGQRKPHPLLRFVEDWSERGLEAAMADYIRAREHGRRIAHALDQVVAATSWEQARASLREHAEVLDAPENRDFLTGITKDFSEMARREDVDPGTARSAAYHVELFQRILAHGTSRTIEEFDLRFSADVDRLPTETTQADPTHDERIAAALNGLFANRSVEATGVYIEHNRELLLSDRALDLLQRSLLERLDNAKAVEAIRWVQELLGVCRERGVPAATAWMRERARARGAGGAEPEGD
ncbi:MAG: hypothetical protein AAF682_16100 [Planctomycetota bacterium]